MIPHVLHQIWLGPPMPRNLAVYRRAWQRFHPRWEHRLWTDGDFGWLTNQDLFDRADELSPRNVGQFRSDVARMEILYRFGGVYADCDMEPLRRIDRLLRGTTAFTFKHPTPDGKPRVDYPYLTNALIGAEPGHPAIKAVIDGMPASCVEHAGLRVVFTVGIHYITHVWEGRKDIRVYPSRWAYPYGPHELRRAAGPFPGSYAVHHWNNVRSGGHVEDAA